VKFKLVKIEDAAYRWVPDVSLSKNKCMLYGFIFFPVIAGYLAFISNPPLKFKLHNVEGRC
jgi:hypothetical protein